MSNTPTLPRETGTEYHYRLVYFKYCGCVRVPYGASVPWDSLPKPHLFKTFQVIDLPVNFNLDIYTAADSCPAIVREHVATWLANMENYLPQPRRCSRRDW